MRPQQIIVAALALTCGLLATTPWRSPPALAHDPLDYATLARHIRFDHAYSYGAVHTWGEDLQAAPPGALHLTADRAPLFPLLIAILWGNDPAHPPTRTVMTVNVILRSLTALLTYSVAAQIVPGAAFVAGLLVAIWPLAIVTEAAPLSEALFNTLMMAGIFWWQRDRQVASGLSFGLATLTRLSLLPFLILLPIVGLAVPAWRRRGIHIIGLVALLTIAPWTMRNAISLHRFVPVATAGSGANILLGTIVIPPMSGGNLWETYLADPSFSDILSRGDEDYLAEAAMRDVGIRRIVTHPVNWIVGRIIQYPRFLLDPGGDYWPYGGPLATMVRALSLSASLGLLLLAGLGAYAASVRHRLPAAGPALAMAVFLMAVHFPLYSDRRHGAPLIPLLAVLASIGWRWGFERLPLAAVRRAAVPADAS